MLQGSGGITPGINVNRKPHDLAFALERLRFESNRHGPSLEDAGGTRMQAPDTTRMGEWASFSILYLLRGSQRPRGEVPSVPIDEHWKRSY